MSKELYKTGPLVFLLFCFIYKCATCLKQKRQFLSLDRVLQNFISVIYTFRGQARVISSCNYSLMLNSKAGTNPGPISPTFLVPKQSSFCADNF
jgi:hypothetical protein